MDIDPGASILFPFFFFKGFKRELGLNIVPIRTAYEMFESV